MIRLVKDWKKVLMLSMSFWAQVVGLLVMVVPEVHFRLTGIDSDPVMLYWTGVLLLVFGLVGRLVHQSDCKLYEWIKILAVILIITLLVTLMSTSVYAHTYSCDNYVESTKEDEALDIAVPLIAKWEGKRNHAYLDIVGVPTICYGSTRGVELGMYKTDDECTELLRKEVVEYRQGWLNYVVEDAYNNWLPSERDAAYTSLTYNVGISAAGKSTATRRLNDGNIVGGCKAIGWWNRAGGRVIRGLTNRRAEETELCLVGV